MQSSASADFANSLTVHTRFVSALPSENYQPVPDDWFVAVTDVVKSRKAIAEGRYKAVNIAGVSMISAVMNALGRQDILYIFGGDGAAVAFAPEDSDVVSKALAATCGWVEDELELELRAAIVPVKVIRDAKSDLLVAAVRVSPAIRNYAFIGGGISLAETLMKQGHYRIERAGRNARPDLTGLSCRWTPIEEKGLKIISLIVEPVEGQNEIDSDSVQELMRLVQADSANASPMPNRGPGFKWPPDGLPLEVKASGMRKLTLYLITILAWVLDRTGIRLGGFDPIKYREVTSLNTDYRKIQDGIRMTVSMNRDQIAQLRELLSARKDAGKLRYGICEQDKAVLTCFVPSITTDNHFHFLDGAGGGYAAAADDMQ
ncbi:MAG: DUF3095 family protein [Pseudomonadota bacterium]